MKGALKLTVVAIAVVMWVPVSTLAHHNTEYVGGVGGVHCTANGTVHLISITNFQFNDTELSVWEGETVKWINDSNTQHTTTQDSFFPWWDSGNIDPTTHDYFEAVFCGDIPASYDYHCEIHGQMTGNIFYQGS